MKSYSRKIFILIILDTCFIWNTLSAQHLKLEFELKLFMEKFCIAEVNGYPNSERMEFVKFSPERAKIEKNRELEFHGKIIDLRAERYFIVDTFMIVGIEAGKKSAKIKVAFRNLAQSFFSDSIIADFKEKDTVVYNLVNNKSRWWIIDPPMPRIYIDTVVNEYKDFFQNLGENWINRTGLTEEQKSLWNRERFKLKLLDSLKSELGMK